MRIRADLQLLLEGIMESTNVYFQPPSTVMMKYPCIVYKRIDLDSDFANNRLYLGRTVYEVILIDKNPDTIYINKILSIPLTKYVRQYVTNNLYHDVFRIYY